MSIEEAEKEEFDLVVCPGGMPGKTLNHIYTQIIFIVCVCVCVCECVSFLFRQCLTTDPCPQLLNITYIPIQEQST